MNQTSPLRARSGSIFLNKIKTYFSKPYNVILLLLGIVLTFTTIAPIVAIVQDTFKIHPGTIDAHLTGKTEGYTLVNYVDLFTSKMAKKNLWTPLLNTVLLAIGTCVVSILFGGIFAFLITRTNLAWRKYLSSIFIFPYIMPQWTLAVVWQNLFNSNAVTGTSDGLIASLFGVNMPKWWCQGLFPSLVVLGLHYAPFAYILIGGISATWTPIWRRLRPFSTRRAERPCSASPCPWSSPRFCPQCCWCSAARWAPIPCRIT